MSDSSTSSTSSEIEEAARRFTVLEPTDELHINEPLPGALYRRRRQGSVRQADNVDEPNSPQLLRCLCQNCTDWVGMRNCEKRCCKRVPEVSAIKADT